MSIPYYEDKCPMQIMESVTKNQDELHCTEKLAEKLAEKLVVTPVVVTPVYDAAPAWQGVRRKASTEKDLLDITHVEALPLPESHEPLYRRLAAAVEELIRRGCLRAGDRMPSLRTLSRRYGVSIPTATQAYVLLETRGVVEARTRSGFYLRGRRPPLQRKNELRKSADSFLVRLIRDATQSDVISFGLCTPAPRFLPSLKLSRALSSAARRMGTKSVEYDLISGNLSLRQQIVKRSVEWGCVLGPEDIIITNGGTEALALCIRAICNPGDTLAVESPMSPVVVLMLRELGIQTLEISCYSPNGLVIPELGQLLSTCHVQGLLLTPNFNNPTGALMPDRNKKALVELCRFHNIPIIEDDIHGDLAFEGKRPMCLKALDRNDSIMLCGSFSRTLAASYRIGYVVPGKFYRDVIDRKAVTTLSNPTLPAMAVAEFFANGGYEYHLRSLRRALAEQMKITKKIVLHHFPPGTRVVSPRGGPALWVELPDTVDADALFQIARQEKICIIPGSAFSISQTTYKNFIRIAYAHSWSETQTGALIRLGEMVEQMLNTGGNI